MSKSAPPSPTTCCRLQISFGFSSQPECSPRKPVLGRQYLRYDTLTNGAVPQVINAVINAAPNIWMYYCFDAEYLFYPFCESRRIGEILEFNTSEDRNAMMILVIDLYAADLTTTPNAVSLTDAMIDATGYYAPARTTPDNHNFLLECQLDFYGGLRWRFEQYVPKRSVESAVWRCFYVNAGCNCRQMRRSMIPAYKYLYRRIAQQPQRDHPVFSRRKSAAGKYAKQVCPHGLSMACLCTI